MKYFFLLIAFFLIKVAIAQENQQSPANIAVEGIADLHSHPAMHLSYNFLLDGKTPDDAPNTGITPEHARLQHMYKDWLIQSGVKLYVAAAIPNVFAYTREAAWEQVEEQMRYVEDFASRYSENFYVAKDPASARQKILEGKVVFVHAFEGGEFLVDSLEDARHWAKRGVSMIGPIHLIDNFYGEASIIPGGKSVLNWRGYLWRRMLGAKPKGLTPMGEHAMEYLFRAGIIIDTAHMNERSLDQTLTLAEAQDIPLISSHGYLREFRKEDRAWTVEQIERFKKLRGLLAITLAPKSLVDHPGPSSPSVACELGLGHYARQYVALTQQLGADEPIAYGSDFNGMVDHFFPCDKNSWPELPTIGDSLDPYITNFWSQGLRHPGDLPAFKKALTAELSKKQLDTRPHDGSAERFLQIWEKALSKK